MGNKINKDKDFSPIVKLINQAQNKVYTHINTEFVSLYWKVGKYVSEKVKKGIWETT